MCTRELKAGKRRIRGSCELLELASDTSQERVNISGAPIRRLKRPKDTQLELRSMMKSRAELASVCSLRTIVCNVQGAVKMGDLFHMCG